MFQGTWYPICRVTFRDNDHGSTTFCRKLGFRLWLLILLKKRDNPPRCYMWKHQTNKHGWHVARLQFCTSVKDGIIIVPMDHRNTRVHVSIVSTQHHVISARTCISAVRVKTMSLQWNVSKFGQAFVLAQGGKRAVLFRSRIVFWGFGDFAGGRGGAFAAKIAGPVESKS